ncbi:mechanosensitive ion channel family protein [Xanthobacter sp. TB0139]|uniref:mechanosensitive ion channel family protein n=1 Tax=Xanthobacter sp. TB0139 TaxID=3459178 RepID=UPI0040391012
MLMFRQLRQLWLVSALFLTAALAIICLGAPLALAQEQAQTQAVPADASSPVTNPATNVDNLSLLLVPLTKDELAAVAEKWQTIVKGKTATVVETQLALADAPAGEQASALRTQLTGLIAERDRLFDKFTEVINAFEKKGGNADKVKEYRAYRNTVFLDETRSSDFRTLAARIGGWAISRDGGLALGWRVAVILVSLLALVFVARLVRRGVSGWVRRVPNLSRLLQAFLVAVIYWVVMAFGLMIVLSALGVDISPVFALIGGASFIMAFAFQDTLANLASGLMIMVNRPFDEGHYVSVGGVAGTVKSVSIVATKVITPDNQVIVIPNKQVWGTVITNVTVSDTRRVDLVFGISYEDSIEAAQQVLEEVVNRHPLVLKDPAPNIRVSALGESSVDFIVRPWTKGADYWTVYWDLMRDVKIAFDRAGISIPYPQRMVHMQVSEAPAPVNAAPSRLPADESRSQSNADKAEMRGAEGYDPN